jgi:hypothetical protein
MHFSCECGNTIRDTTDYLPNKAFLLADQDHFPLIEELEQVLDRLAFTLGAKEDWKFEANVSPIDDRGDLRNSAFWLLRNTVSKYIARNLYQCGECGRIFVDRAAKNEPMVSFKPDEPARSQDVLGSCLVLLGHKKNIMV